MPSFGASSEAKLLTCDPRLVEVARAVVLHVDCTVLYGRRGKAEQDKAVAEGHSKTAWPFSKHNCPDPLDPQLEDLHGLSKAIDLAPYPLLWPESAGTDQARRLKLLARLYAFSGYVKATGHQLGIGLRSGCDWDGDWDFTDQSFDDLPHFEIVDG